MTEIPQLTELIDHLTAEAKLISLNEDGLKEELVAAQNGVLSEFYEEQSKRDSVIRSLLIFDQVDDASQVPFLEQMIREVHETLTDKVLTRDRLIKLQEDMAKLEDMATTLNTQVQQAQETWDRMQEFIHSEIDTSLHRQMFGQEILNHFGVPMVERWTEIRLALSGQFNVASQQWFTDLEGLGDGER